MAQKKISAFDLDHTLVFSNSSLLFYRYLVSRGLYKASSLIATMMYSVRHYCFQLSLSALHEKAFKSFLKGVSVSLIEREVKKFLDKDFYKFLYQPALSRLRLAQHQGHYTVILSNGPSFLVGPIAEYLGVDDWKASSYAIDRNRNEFSDVESILIGSGKAGFMKHLVDRLHTSEASVTAYSDSHHDWDFLMAAGYCVAVNPSLRLKRRLKRLYRENGRENEWEIL